MTKKEFLESGLIEQYVMGLTYPEESEEVEHMMELYPDIRERVEEMKAEMTAFCRVRAIQDLRHPGNPGGVRKADSPMFKSRLKVWQNITAASVFLLVAVMLFFFIKLHENALEIDYLSDQVHRVRAENVFLSHGNQMLLTHFTMLKDSHTRHVTLSGSKLAPEAKAIIYWNQQLQNACLDLINMPSPPKSHQFQVWAVVNGEHQNLGLVRKDSDGDFQPIPYMQNCSGFAITLEKEGGSTVPSTDQIYAYGGM